MNDPWEGDENELSVHEAEKPLVEPSYIDSALPDLIQHWARRNELIKRAREHLSSEYQFRVKLPEDTNFDVIMAYMFNFRAMIGERTARFTQVPTFRVLPEDDSEEAREKSSRLERAISQIYFWARRKNDDWGKAVLDCLAAEIGAIRWEMDAAAAWPRFSVLHPDPENPEAEPEDDVVHGMPTGERRPGEENLSDAVIEKRIKKANEARKKARHEYTRKQGVAKLFTHTYIPAEAIYPFPDQDVPEEFIEIEFQSLAKVLKNERYSDAAKVALRSSYDKNSGKKIDVLRQIPIVRYCNNDVYCYFALLDYAQPDTKTDNKLEKFIEGRSFGNSVYLYGYEHEAGTPNVTILPGLHGWGSGDQSMVEGKLTALLHVDENIDRLSTQFMTISTAMAWPRFKRKQSLDRPVSMLDDGDPEPGPVAKAGKDVELYTGEDMEPLMSEGNHTVTESLLTRLERQMAKLGAAPGLYGLHAPGVDGGFQEETLLREADSQFAKIDANIQTAAVNDVYVLLSLIRAAGERVWVRGKSADGKRVQEDYIDPEDLEIMPVIDAVVRSRAGGSFSQRLRDYAAAVSDPNGIASRAFPDSRARELFLDSEHPERDEEEVVVDVVKRHLLETQLLPAAEERWGLRQAQELIRSAPQVDPGVLMEDPEAAAQMALVTSGGAPPAPTPSSAMNPRPDGGLAGMPGLPTGVGHPEATIGRQEQVMTDGARA